MTMYFVDIKTIYEGLHKMKLQCNSKGKTYSQCQSICLKTYNSFSLGGGVALIISISSTVSEVRSLEKKILASNFNVLNTFCRCNDYVDKRKKLHKKWAWHHSYQGLWLVQMGIMYAKSWTWCDSFQPFRSHNLCIVVFCLLFSIMKYVKRQVFHLIIIRNY